MKRHVSRTVALASLVVAPLAVLTATSPTASAGGATSFLERWCVSVATPRPCLESVTRNDSPVTEASTNWEVLSTGQLMNDGMPFFMFLVNDLGGPSDLTTTDTWVFMFDTGTIDPTYTEGFAGRPDVDRIEDGDGTFHVRYTAHPILYTEGCDTESLSWPWTCTATATDEYMKLEAEVWERTDEFSRFNRSQSPQGVNGIFLETASDGSRYLSSEMVNSHFRVDGSTVFEGEVRFRIPYTMLRDSFGVPDPSTMVASSLSGTVNGSTTAATFTVVHDPDGGGMIVDITDLTFSLKRIKVRRGVIVPTRPKDVVGDRLDATHAKLSFTESTPRGANVTDYLARCESPGGHVVTRLKDDPSSPVRLGGLRAGVPYSCKVRAKSKAGYGPWSAAASVTAQVPH